MRLAFAITSLCALLSSLMIDQVSASPNGAARQAVPRAKGAYTLPSKNQYRRRSSSDAGFALLVRLNRQDAPASRLHERGWQFGHWGWGGWGWGQRNSPILAGMVTQAVSSSMTVEQTTCFKQNTPATLPSPLWTISFNLTTPSLAVPIAVRIMAPSYLSTISKAISCG
jgi:hypothetical protein